jgi:integrase
VTFDTRLDAGAWLGAQGRDVDRGTWVPPEKPASRADSRLCDYAAVWLAERDLTPRTRREYQILLNGHILPDLGDVELGRMTPTAVRSWFASLNPDTPTRRAHAYSLLRTIFSTAVEDDLVEANPCRIRGAGQARRRHDPRPATLGELEIISGHVPAQYRAMVLLAAWCGLRWGELTELRRHDVDLGGGVLRVTRGVTRVGADFVIGEPKSRAGRRTVAIPPHLMDAVRRHLDDYTAAAKDALLFPARGGGHMQPSTLSRVFYPAREAAGRPDLRFHDLRHTGAVLAAATGATLAELMARLGHSTPAAAMVYQHAAADRDRAIAQALSGLAQREPDKPKSVAS